MENYKRLVSVLKLCSQNNEYSAAIWNCDIAADAIENLLAERDSLLNDLRGNCCKCKHHVSHNECNTCMWGHTLGASKDNWMWVR